MLLCLPSLQPLTPAFHPRTKVAALTCPKFSYSPAVSPRTAVTFTDSRLPTPTGVPHMVTSILKDLAHSTPALTPLKYKQRNRP